MLSSGQGLGRLAAFESVFFSNPEGRSFNCILPMPFQTGFKIVLTNDSPLDIRMLFYDVNYTLGDRLADPVYLHAHWRRENPTTSLRDFEILPRVAGRGRYLGANFSVETARETYGDTWWGEGECKIFLDGDGEQPTLVGTGTEDYIGTAWGQGRFSHLYQGCHVADPESGQYAFYRYHVPDPIYFHTDIRVTIQQIGGALAAHIDKLRRHSPSLQLTQAGPEAGTPVNMHAPEGYEAIFERQDDWASCCYFYIDRPDNGLRALALATGDL